MKKLTIMLLLLCFMLFGCVTPNPDKELLKNAKKELSLPESTSTDLELVSEITFQGKTIEVTWESNDDTIIDTTGKVTRDTEENRDVTLTAQLTYNEINDQVSFVVTVLAFTPQELMAEVLNTITFPGIISENITLPLTYPYNISASWQSSDETVLTSEGELLSNRTKTFVSLTLTLSLKGEQMKKTFNFIVPLVQDENQQLPHLILTRIDDFNEEQMTNLIKVNDTVQLVDGALQGEYVSEIFAVNNVKSIVGSWSAETSINFTVELLVRVNVGGVWSDYLSYSEWGLGRQNKGVSKSSSNNVAKMSYDEIIINNSKVASQVQYKVILRRIDATTASPKLRLVALALEMSSYSYQVDTTNLPQMVNYVVPQLNQNIVPVIGDSICSPTSSTMLLKYKGYDFTSQDQYEHRYIANLAKDYGHNIFGNWVYNVATIGAFGEISYVKRMYSLDELRWHLANVGPIAASVKGNMEGLYNTSGHLIVIRGYKYVDNTLYFICNDPNLKNVYYEYKASTIQTVWRNIAYVIE